MLLLIRQLAVITAMAVFCGCASRSATYRLVPTDEGSVLLPPGVKNTSVTARKVRLKGLPPGECPAGAHGIALRRRRKSLRLEVTQRALHMRPNGWLLGWAGELEGSGCLPPGQGLAAARLVAQVLPSNKGREHALLSSATRTTGRSDLLPWMKLRVTTPIFRERTPAGAPIAADDPGIVEGGPGGLAITLNPSADFAGYELAWYGLRPRLGGGVQMALEYSETHIGNLTTRQEASLRPIEFGAGARYFRILVLTRISDHDHDTAFLSGRTLAELETRTKIVEADPASCQRTVGCVGIDTRVALLPFVMVQANGREVLVQPGSTVREAVLETGVSDPDGIAASLTVEREYAGRLTPIEAEEARSELLGLILLGGETITWQTDPGR